jgi:two-component system chemotaxis response regulator CheB
LIEVTGTAAGQVDRIRRDIVVVGASAGGVEALTTVIGGLPAELPASVFVVLHLSPSGFSVLPAILERSGPLPASAARDGEPIERGHVYVAPPDFHMLVDDGCIRLTRGPRENAHRPAIDPLFRSAARSYGERCIGVILSGALDDGAAGLRYLKGRGGLAIVQDPEDALYPGMPTSAAASVDVDAMAPARELAAAIQAAVDSPSSPLGSPASGATGNGASDAVAQPQGRIDVRSEGDAAGIACPECGGALYERESGALLRFACQVGHVYSPDSLIEGQAHALEGALWTAVRSLEERADLLRRMARRSVRQSIAERLEQRASDVEEQARVVSAVAGRVGRASPPGELRDASIEGGR